MSWLDGLWTWGRRVDVRLGCILAVLFAPLVAAVLFALYLFAASELLELATLEVDERLTELETLWSEPDSSLRSASLALLAEQLALDAGGFRVSGADGRVLQLGGLAPRRAIGARGPDFLRAARMRADDVLDAQRSLPSGVRLEVFLSSAGLVRERNEILQGFWISLAVGVGLVGLVAIPATRLALAPLRRATAVAASIDAHRLEARLPTRDTRDDVDRHAQAINRLFEEIEAGFMRLRGFSQDVAHELRTPLGRIRNEVELRLLDGGTDPASRSALESIARSAEHMSRMVDGLLLLARGDEVHPALSLAPVDVADLCHTLQAIYEPACDEAAIRLELASEGGFVLADATLLLRALGNLIDNALRHTPANGWINLQTRVDEGDPGFMTFEVRDSGPGIPAEQREHVFERFARLSEASGAEGVGLGLPITRSIARAFGGEVELRHDEACPGERPTPGACFVVRIRRSPDEGPVG